MEYPKIETLYERDAQTHRLKPDFILKNRVYGLLKSWEWTEKIDGMNIRLMWRGGKMSVAGRTNNAQIHPDLLAYLHEAVTPELMAACFTPGEDGTPSDAVVYGEGYGAGIQRGAGYSAVKRFVIFDVLVDGKWWLAWENVCDVARKLGLPVVPFVGTMTLDDATDLVRGGFRSFIGGSTMLAEGLVGRPLEPLFDKRGHRLIVKLKTKDF